MHSHPNEERFTPDPSSQFRAELDGPILLFLERDILPEEKLEAEKIRRKVPRFWLSEDKSCINVPFLGHICFMYIPRYQSHS